MIDMVCRQSTSTARDMARAMIEDVTEEPSIEAAARIADEYALRGVYIRPEYLLEVWTDEKSG